MGQGASNSMISFIVPIYKPNLEVLEKSIKSLAVQALKDWEAIFVLDGPCPEAEIVIRRAIKKCPNNYKIMVIEHGGAPRARNKGAEMAQGDVYCFWDSDCVIEPGTSKLWYDTFAKSPEVGFVYSGYKFFGDSMAIDSEPWDAWQLRVRNFISTCFPVRREIYPGWCEDLESLQDWDFWLSVVEKAEKAGWDIKRIGKYYRGYAFSTPFPTPDSISGKGCTPEKWLERMDAVKKRHGIEQNAICVSSLQYKADGVLLAKNIGADFQIDPSDKPNHYKTIIQVGFSLSPNHVERHAAIFQRKDIKKVLFWTGDNINEIYNSVCFKAVDAYSNLLNDSVTQYVEDLEAKRLMERAGFKVQVRPIPLVNTDNIVPMPEKVKFAIDVAADYGQVFGIIERSLPDVELEVVDGVHSINDYTGLIHFYPDKTLSHMIKRAILSGRHVISNVKQPYCGYISDKESQWDFILGVVEKVRDIIDKKDTDPKALEHYKETLNPEKLKEAIA